jgi:hypothetical protein
MVAGVGLRTVASVMQTYPTQADAIKRAAEACARSNALPLAGWLARRWIHR